MLSFLLYRKLTRTDQYLHWDSQHNLATKCNAFKPLHTEQELFLPTLNFYKIWMSEVLQICKYSTRVLNRTKIKVKPQQKPSNNTNNKNKPELSNKNITHMVVPYTRRFGESVKNICNKHGIPFTFQRRQYYQETTGVPKDWDIITLKSGVT